MSKPSELKKRLIQADLEVFRVQGSRVHIADRVRENLIMDSGVCAVAGDRLAVRFVVRAQQAHFPGEGADELFGRARSRAAEYQKKGYTEVESAVVPVDDPSGGASPLDVWYEVSFEKPVETEELVDELRYALGLEKTAGTS